LRVEKFFKALAQDFFRKKSCLTFTYSTVSENKGCSSNVNKHYNMHSLQSWARKQCITLRNSSREALITSIFSVVNYSMKCFGLKLTVLQVIVNLIHKGPFI